jgi:DNA repair ATPase RecN
MGKREEDLTLMENQLNAWRAKTEPFKVGAGQWEAQIKAQYEKNIEVLHAKRDEAWENLAKLKNASEGAWDQTKSKMDKAWEELKSTTERLTTQRKK